MVLRRREAEQFGAAAVWLETALVPDACMADGHSSTVKKWSPASRSQITEHASVNAWYLHNPQAIIGQYQWENSQHGQKALPRFSGTPAELAGQLLTRVQDLAPADIYHPPVLAGDDAALATARAVVEQSGLQPGTLVQRSGRLWMSEGHQLMDVDDLYAGKARQRVLGMIEVREAARELIRVQARDCTEAELQRAQDHLNRIYDAFVKAHGHLADTANARVFRSDPDWPVLMSLEVWDPDAETYRKAAIFSQRTVGTRKLAERVDTVTEALAISLAQYGRVVVKDMAARMRVGIRQVLLAMRENGCAFKDPMSREWVAADEYLSGDVQAKLDTARLAGTAYESNVLALSAALPQPLGPGEIDVRLGSSWVPPEILGDFAADLVQLRERAQVEVVLDTATATYSVKTNYARQYTGSSTAQKMTWGTRDRCAFDLLEQALNQETPKITRTSPSGATFVDEKATAAAREKLAAIREHFKSWVWQDSARRDRLVAIYNDTFNRLVPRRFSGAHLNLPGMSMAVTPRADQLDAIWRIVCSGNTLLGHCVGAGKTLIMVAAGMELRRLGRASKIVHVVFNSTLDQYAGELVRFYPQARVLIARKEDLSGDKRRAFVARAATGDYDAIVMTQATFERLSLGEQYVRAFFDEEIARLRAFEAAAIGSASTKAIKELEKRIKRAEAQLDQLIENGKRDASGVGFEEIGVDWLMIDEAHAYKSLEKFTKNRNALGLGGASSQRAFDVYMKTRLIMQRRGGEEGVVMATGTFIANSLSDLWAMQTFLQRATLERMGIAQFDAWIATFAEAVNMLEPSPDGSGYRTVTRYAHFSNVPELMAILLQVADIKTRDDLKLPVPALDGGKVQVVAAPASAELKAFTEKLVERAALVRGRAIKPDEDNMLKIATDGRAAAVDLRLVRPDSIVLETTKLDLAARKIAQIWREGDAQRHTQMVFCDVGTPSGVRFSVYSEMRRKLLALGVTAEHIAFIHDHDTDAKRRTLFRAMREGVVRVLFGSTTKLGVGVDVQNRLRALHHLDVPYRPCDLEQRDGRGLRQGNLCESLGIYRYVTTGSMDTWSWNIVDTKARFIDQLLRGGRGVRRVEDVSDAVISYAELKAIASGDPLVMEKAQVDLDVIRLAQSRAMWENERWHAQREVARRESAVNDLIRELPQAQALAQTVPRSLQAPFVGAMRVDPALGRHEAIGSAFVQATADKAAVIGASYAVGTVGEFAFAAARGARWELMVRHTSEANWREVDRPSMHDAAGVGKAALQAIEAAAARPQRLEERLATHREEIARLQAIASAPFAKEAALASARARQAALAHQLERDRDMDGAGGEGEEPAAEPAAAEEAVAEVA